MIKAGAQVRDDCPAPAPAFFACTRKGAPSLLSFVTLASGSSGNAALVSCGQTHILLDAGISARRITTALRGLGVDPASLSGVLITHEHTDHISGLATLTKQLGLPVYATAPTLDALAMKVPAIPEKRLGRFFAPGESFSLGELWIEPFATSHDAACSVGYAISGGDSRMVLCTDLGYISRQVERAVAGCDLLVCEANHDEEWVRTGPYPYYLKQRVLGRRGHLSNEAGAQLALLAAQNGARTILLAHLSEENNTPAHALEVVGRTLRQAGFEDAVTLEAAPRKEPGRVYYLSRQGIRQEAAVC